MNTIVVNAKFQEFDVYIGRESSYHKVADRHVFPRITSKVVIPKETGDDGYFGNPIRFGYRCQVCGKTHHDTPEGREALCKCFKRYFWNRIHDDPEYAHRVSQLHGLRLGCFCAPKPCHGDVIVAWLEAGMPMREKPVMPRMKIIR